MASGESSGKAHALIWGALGVVIALVLGVSLWGVTSVRPGGAGAGAGGAAGPTVLEITGDHGQVPPFSLLDAARRPVTLADLAGRWWVADFIFTRCEGICPLLSSQMARLISTMPSLDRDDVRFVSFSVDPE